MTRAYTMKEKKRKNKEVSSKYDREEEEEEQIQPKKPAIQKEEPTPVVTQTEENSELAGIPIAPSIEKNNSEEPGVIFVLEKASLEVAKVGKTYQLLNSDDHANFLRKNKKNPGDYRPDICHQVGSNKILLFNYNSICVLQKISFYDFFQLNSATPNPKILIISTPASLIRSIDLEASLHDDSASSELNLNFIHPQSSVEIKGSCNGFIYDFASMCLWNPSNGVHKQIPSSPYNSNCFYYLDGFGYDPSTDDYLIVSMFYDPALEFVSHLQFFSFRANTWKEIEGTYLPYMNAGDNSRVGSLVNGTIHWVAFNSDTSIDVIVAFDLAERKLVEMFLPDDFNIDSNFYELWVFGEFLSLWSWGDDTVEIWVMKEYKVQSSWTMTLVLPMNGYFSPICCTIRGDIIGTDGGTRLVKYDDKGQLLEHRSYGVAQHGSQVAMYVESLLSLPVDSVQS